MSISPRSTLRLGVLAVGATLALSACAAAPADRPSTPISVFSHVSAVTTIVDLDLAAGQLPENITDAGDSVAVTFAASRQIATVSPTGEIEILGTLPDPAGGGVATPVLGFALATGLAVADGSYYVLYATGEADTTGLWSLDDGTFELVAALPAAALPNGLTYDADHGRFFAADSALGVIYSIDLGGTVETWSADAGLAAAGFLGANGVQLHDGDLYVSNLDAGTILRIDIADDGSAGELAVGADGLPGIDDFAFTGRGDQIIATLNPSSEVVLVDDGERTTVLTDEDGLTNPTSVLVRGDDIYVASAAYVNQDHPNLLSAQLRSK